MNILVVDDDPLYLGLVSEFIQARDSRSVFCAKDGKEADDILHTEDIDLIITDIFMPGKDGIEIIIQETLNTDIPIIAMSGSNRNSEAYLDMCGKLGAKKLLHKPFTQQELNSAIQQCS